MRSGKHYDTCKNLFIRLKLWMTLATHYISKNRIDWKETCRVAFNENLNPEDDCLSSQIIKDLHRTGWSGLKSNEEKLYLKRVLLGYARFNKEIGYCQGFNIIAALVLDIMDYNEEASLKVMIFLIEQVLPYGYFDKSLHAMSVDMAVLRELLYQRLPVTAKHFDRLQISSASDYEPPVINVFSMQWFLTLFANCLPKSCLCRVWDALMLEGSEILLRVALVIWAKASRKILRTSTADEFYSLMGTTVCQDIMQMRNAEINEFVSVLYSLSPFPYPGIAELRERYTFNIQPFTKSYSLFQRQVDNILRMPGDEGLDSDITPCFLCTTETQTIKADLANLWKEYKQLRQRQKQAAIILQTAFEKSLLFDKQRSNTTGFMNDQLDNKSTTPVFNHLYVGTVFENCFTNNSTAENPLHMTLCGNVPVTPRIVQPSEKLLMSSSHYSTSNGKHPNDGDFSFMKEHDFGHNHCP